MAIASGHAAAAGDLRDAEQHVDEWFTALPKVMAEVGTDFGSRSPLDALKSDWDALKRDGSKLSLDDSIKTHQRLLKRARRDQRLERRRLASAISPTVRKSICSPNIVDR